MNNHPDLQSLISRRRALTMGLQGAAALTAFPAIARALTATPPLTEGPYFVEEKLLRSDIRSDTSTGVYQTGLPLKLWIYVYYIKNNKAYALPNAYVDIWHCNAAGKYSDESSEGTVGQNWLRGYQLTTSTGMTQFKTIYPGWYSGRTTHIHCRVRLYKKSTTIFNFETQFFFDDTTTAEIYTISPYKSHGQKDTANLKDNIYNSKYTDTDGTIVNPAGSALTLAYRGKKTYAIGAANLYLRVS